MKHLDDLFFELVTIAQPDLFIEAGAFEASTSLHVAETIPGCDVIAFEANPENHRHFTAAEDYERRGVTYLNLALTDTPGPITFYVESKEGSAVVGYSSTLARTQDVEGPAKPITVEGVRIDDRTPEAERVAMWVDVEGATDKVLAGATKRLGACEVLKVEVEEAEFWEGQALSIDILSQLLAAGMMPVARDIETASQYNVLFASPRLLRNSAALDAIDTFLATIQEPEPWPPLARARAHPLYGRASRLVRGT